MKRRLRSLDPNHSHYQGNYGGDQRQRVEPITRERSGVGSLDPSSWHFVLAHLRVYSDPVKARQFLEPMANQFSTHCIGTLSEIFDGDAPMKPNGCIAQAWTIAEVLRAWLATEVEK